MMNVINIVDFNNYKLLLEKNIVNKAFRSRMLFEALDEEVFSQRITEYINAFNNCTSSTEIDALFEKIRENTTYYYNLSKTSDKFIEKIQYGLKSLAYFYFLESMNEHSIFSEKVVDDIKESYPDNYLDVISKIDKIFLSVDVKSRIDCDSDDFKIEDDLLKKYIVLKQWQDKQHHYFEEEYGKYLEELQYHYVGNKTLNSFDLEQFSLRKRMFDKLDEQKILDLNTCSVLSELYIKKYVVKYIGGKMYGLSVLNSKGIKVPYSVVIPVNIEVNDSDLKALNNSFSHFSVRSSADIEDGDKNSFAGMFDSYLNVSKNDILDNVVRVKNSVNNKRLKEYIKANNLDEPNMAVVIQSFKEPSYAGVWIGNSEKSGVLEWVEGNGEKLVSGSYTPHSEFWNDGASSNALKLNGEEIGKKMLDYQKKVGCNADFEWMILDNELIMLQFRPVTRKVIISDRVDQVQEDEYVGIPASPGVVQAYASYVDSPENEINKNKILLALMTDPNWIPHLMSSKGAVTARGGFLCHTAIVCRELGIPCITGVGENAIFELSEADSEIYLDGNSGKVKKIKTKQNFEYNKLFIKK